MLIQVIGFNAIILAGLVGIGVAPTQLLERKFRTLSLSEFLFSSALIGYFIFESVVATWVTRGQTVQLVNFLPLVFLFFLPDNTETKIPKKQDWLSLLTPILILLFASWYFVKSYAPDLQSIEQYPFIDLVSYASSTFGMVHSGHETTYFDSAIYYPDKFKFNLYHFTELWALAGWSKIFGITELWGISFLLPVVLLALMALGFSALGSSLKISPWVVLPLVFTLIFANGKLLFFEDFFLFNSLDLCGLKLSLLIPVLMFLIIIRHQTALLLAFTFWLPQVNILYIVALGLLWVYFLAKEKTAFFKILPLAIWVLPTAFLAVYGFLLLSNPGESQEFPLQPFSLLGFLNRSFTYFREAVFNLGYNYWIPMVVISALTVNWKNGLLLIPFGLPKLVSKLLMVTYLPAMRYASITEVLIFILSLWAINRLARIWNPTIPSLILGGLFILCLIAGIGNFLTGYMDFEQIYTLISASVFTIIAFLLFAPKKTASVVFSTFQSSKWFPFVMSVLCVGLIFKTIRFQRVIPFDKSFYSKISDVLKKESGPKFSAYFSSKSYYPFPLHVQAGFPLLFSFSDALSTPVTPLENTSWMSTERQTQVENFPLMIFANKDSQFLKNGNLEEMQLRFLKEFQIRYLWVDQDYSSAILDSLTSHRKSRFVSNKEGLEFWTIEP